MKRTEREIVIPLLIAVLAAGAVMTIVLTWKLTFWQDTFDFLILRRDITWDTVMAPHNEHITVFPALIEMAIMRVFGLGNAHPEYILLTAFLIAAALLVFVYVRRHLGYWAGLFATILILCLGPAWEVLLWPFEIGFIGSVVFGVAMFLALERESRGWDLAACAFLILSMGFSSLGLPFAVGAAVDVLQKRRTRGWSRAYLVVVPLVLFALWYLGWGRDAESHMTIHNVFTAPRFVIESAAIALGSLFGLGTNPINGETTPLWGALILVGLGAGLFYLQRRRPGFSPTLWPVAAAALANWVLTAFNQIPGRDPTSSRYQYAGAIFILLVLANLLPRITWTRRALIVAAAVVICAVGPNLVVLKGGRNGLDLQTVYTKADLAAIEIARRTVDPEFQLGPEVAGTPSLVNVYAGDWLEADDEYGSPAYSEAELAAAPAPGPQQADIVLSQALPLRTLVTPDAYAAGGGRENCVTVPGDAPVNSEVKIDPGATRIEVAPGEEAHLNLRRFSPRGEYPVPTAGAAGGSVVVLRVPRDESPRPWYLHAEAAQAVRVCR
jgi:MFS family permease